MKTYIARGDRVTVWFCGEGHAHYESITGELTTVPGEGLMTYTVKDDAGNLHEFNPHSFGFTQMIKQAAEVKG